MSFNETKLQPYSVHSVLNHILTMEVWLIYGYTKRVRKIDWKSAEVAIFSGDSLPWLGPTQF